MVRPILLSALLLFGFCNLKAQSLYMPRNVKIAFAKGTRSLDGYPGKNYWQNFGRYNITLTALPPDRNIAGSEYITYFNRSPDTLRSLVFKVIQNIHMAGAIRYGDADSTYLTSGVHIDTFMINGRNVRWVTNRAHYTWQEIRLTEPMLPGDSVQLHINWHFQISLKSGREGMIDSTTYYLAYFYPRVAVYDDYYGWDRLNFTDEQEFYNDFNDYTLQVRAPKNYLVWATGELQDPEAVLQPEYATRLENSMHTDSVIHIATPAELKQDNITVQNPINTWIFKSWHITDVATALSDHYDWDASSVVVDDATERRCSVQAAYNDTASGFHQAVAIGQYTLGWFSRNLPGVPFPFPKMTVFQGYADMEYPMMVNDSNTPNMSFFKLVENHEIAHSYFPFYMGTNESRYGFMDEGWATTLELLIGRTENTVEAANTFYKNFRVNRWIHDPSAEEDLPIITPSNVLVGTAYGANAYGKASLGYLAVKDLLGDAMFKKCLLAYMDRWHGKHPIPWDFFNSFSNAAGKNLTWFWNNWYFSNNYIDLAIQGLTPATGGYNVSIDNVGGMAAPFDLIVQYTNGTMDSIHCTPLVWEKDQHKTMVHVATHQKISSVSLDMGLFLDANELDNVWPRKVAMDK